MTIDAKRTVKPAIWLTWERQRRNKSMATKVGATLHELEYKGSALARYWNLGWKTIGIVVRTKPGAIYFQNPSLVLSLLVTTLKFLRLTRARTIGDFHNAGVFPPVAQFLVPWMVRTNDLTLVSNKNLQSTVTAMGGKCVAVPDPLPEIHAAVAVAGTSRQADQFEVFFICSWAPDEPIANVLRAAEILASRGRGISISISGRSKLHAVGWDRAVPDNVELTGFLSEADFDRRLTNCDAILDLTTRADCMVCGAYEAVSVGIPMILSDNEPTKAYFNKGALFTDNSAEDIASAILKLRENHPRLQAEVANLKTDILEREGAIFGLLTTLSGQR